MSSLRLPLCLVWLPALVACGRSPAMPPRTLVVYERVEAAAVAEGDEDELAPAPAPRVEYVRMTEWQPTQSVQRIESEITPRGDEPARYIQFPTLQLHRPIAPPSAFYYSRWR